MASAGPAPSGEDGGVPEVRIATEEDLDPCVHVVLGLPEYFTGDVPDKLRADWARCRTWVVAEGATLLGFAMVETRSPEVAEILWAAVDPNRRHGGLGTRLVREILAALLAQGVTLVEVKTQAESAGYAPYVATRAFWARRGFVHIDTIDPFPEWGPGNPCAIYVCPLGRAEAATGGGGGASQQ